MEIIVKKKGTVLATDKTKKKKELEKIKKYLNQLKNKKALCFECGLDIASCEKIMTEKERLDETNKYDYITEGYQKYEPKTGAIKEFTITKCDNYIEPSEEEEEKGVDAGPTEDQIHELAISYVNHEKGNDENMDYVITYEEAEDIIRRESNFDYFDNLPNLPTKKNIF